MPIPVLLVLLGCRDVGATLTTVPLLPPESIEVEPPKAEGEAQTRLFQLLYAAELGEDTYRLGQRVRIRAWLQGAGLTERQLEGLRTIVRDVRTLQREQAAADAAYAAREAALLGPIYTALDARLQADPPPTEAELVEFGSRLSEARVQAHAEAAPAAVRLERLRKLFTVVEPWVEALSPQTRERVSDARFFLSRHAHPFGNVEAYNVLVGADWDGGQFAQLDETEASADQRQLDIGGLWTVERRRTAPGKYLVARQQYAIVLLAAMDPVFGEVLGVADADGPITER